MRPWRPSRTTRRPTSATRSAVKPNCSKIVAGRRRCTEMVEPDDRALVADPALPAERDADLDADPLAHGRRQDRVAVCLRPARRTAPSTGATRRGSRCPRPRASPRRRTPAAARIPWRSGSARASRRPPRAGRSRRGATPSRASSAVPGRVGSFWRVRASATGPSGPLDGERPGRRRLVGVARTDEPQVRDRPQGGVVLDRLVGRPVLAEADRVVGPDVDDVQPGQRAEPDGAAHVVAERQERRVSRG